MLSESQRGAYELLRERAQDGKSLAASDLEKVSGWTKSSFGTFKSKQLKPYLVPTDRGRFVVRPHFLRVTEEEFEELVTQARRAVATFTRIVFGAFLEYEFLLPMTNERRLRSALDELFYRDHLLLRAREIGQATLTTMIPSERGESDERYLERVVEMVGGLLGGYSIGHVSGRFRAGNLLSHQQAADVLVKRGRYLVDETTAIVRFLLPLKGSRQTHGDEFDVREQIVFGDTAWMVEADVARRLFIAFFVENVIWSIHGEDEIWFLEWGPYGSRLYVLERAAQVSSASSGRARQEQLALPAAQGSPLGSWLRTNGYGAVADNMERVIDEWHRRRLRTRRNWWEILAGDRKGRPRTVADTEFPVIAAIRARQGLPPAKDALSRPGETALPPSTR